MVSGADDLVAWLATLRENTKTYFLCRHGPHDKGTLFLLRTTRNCASGDWPPALDEVVEGGVGVIADGVYFKDR